MHPRFRLAVMLLALVGLAPIARAADTPLIPLHFFAANPNAAWEHRISADGSKLAWIAMRDGRATLHFRKLNETDAQVVRMPREARPPSFGDTFWWKGRHLVFLMDSNGDENAHLFAVDTDAPEAIARDLTPLDGARVEFVRSINNEPETVIVRHNGRNRGQFDLYRVNVVSGQSTLLMENPGSVCGWSVSAIGRVRARVHCIPDGGWLLDVPDGVGGWREIVRGAYGDWLRIIGYPGNQRYAWALSNRGRERAALVRLDLRNGNEEVLFEHPAVDLTGGRVSDTGFLRYVYAWPGYQEWRFYDANLQADLAPILSAAPIALHILSEDQQFRWLTFATESDRAGYTHYLLDRASGDLKVLADSPMRPYAEHLARMQPVSFKARDGLTVHGHLTLPAGKTGPHAMVLLVHGGPWLRDRWGFDTTVQFLANRGYAVLQVDYRGSSEYGRTFFLAGTREFGRKMHDDLIDGVRWAVAQGIADSKRVAIMGASYGGYAALLGAAFTPDVFVAAVDRVGIADMVSLIENWPPYWRVDDMGFWSRFFGDPRKPEERAYLAEGSPLTRVDAIRVPLLVIHGANDVRVRRDHSDRIVAALKARNHDVEYILFPDEGHGINLTSNRLTYYRSVERFLARHLGGRDGGDVAETSTATPGAR
jgi:dienelactone hydrolase